MSNPSVSWPLVSADQPCPTCGRAKSCRVAPDRGAVLCWHSSAGEWQGKPRQLRHCPARPPTQDAAPPRGDARTATTYATVEHAATALRLRLKGAMAGGLWLYRDADGRPIMAVTRLDLPDGSKTCRPLSPMPDGRWRVGDPPGKLPIYGLDMLSATPSTQRLYLVEGERCADALRSIGLPGITSSHGAASAARTDWSPLAGRDVAILPDADSAGEKYAADVAGILTALEPPARVRIVSTLPGPAGDARPAGWDVRDYIALRDSDESEVLAAAIEAMADAAGPWTLDPAETLEVPPTPAAYQPFPVDLLPPAAAAIVRAGAASVGCDPAYLALPALASMAGGIGNTRHAVVKSGWTEPAIVWTMLIGASGTAKTPAAKIVLGPLHQRHGKLIAANEQAMQLYRDDVRRYEGLLAIWKRKAEGDPPREPQPPALERAVIEDTTIEALAPILKANPRGVLLHRDELAGWIGSFDRYAQNGGGDVARWLSIFNGESITVDRKSSGTTHVPLPAVSVVGGIQPDRLPVVLTRTLRDTGLLARILIAHPPAMPKRFNIADLDAAAVGEWQRLITYMSSLEMTADDDGNPQPVCVGMSGDAKTAFGVWADALNAESIEAPGDVASARSKLEAYAVRFALIFAVCETSARIERGHIDRGCVLADWFAAEAERIYERVGQTDDDRDAGALVEWIARRGGRATVRDVACGGPRKFRGKTTAAEAMMNGLVESGRARWQHDSARPGRPSKSLMLVGTASAVGIAGCGIKTTDGATRSAGFDSSASAAMPGEGAADAS